MLPLVHRNILGIAHGFRGRVIALRRGLIIAAFALAFRVEAVHDHLGLFPARVQNHLTGLVRADVLIGIDHLVPPVIVLLNARLTDLLRGLRGVAAGRGRLDVAADAAAGRVERMTDGLDGIVVLGNRLAAVHTEHAVDRLDFMLRIGCLDILGIRRLLLSRGMAAGGLCHGNCTRRSRKFLLRALILQVDLELPLSGLIRNIAIGIVRGIFRSCSHAAVADYFPSIAVGAAAARRGRRRGNALTRLGVALIAGDGDAQLLRSNVAAVLALVAFEGVFLFRFIIIRLDDLAAACVLTDIMTRLNIEMRLFILVGIAFFFYLGLDIRMRTAGCIITQFAVAVVIQKVRSHFLYNYVFLERFVAVAAAAGKRCDGLMLCIRNRSIDLFDDVIIRSVGMIAGIARHSKFPLRGVGSRREACVLGAICTHPHAVGVLLQQVLASNLKGSRSRVFVIIDRFARRKVAHGDLIVIRIVHLVPGDFQRTAGARRAMAKIEHNLSERGRRNHRQRQCQSQHPRDHTARRVMRIHSLVFHNLCPFCVIRVRCLPGFEVHTRNLLLICAALRPGLVPVIASAVVGSVRLFDALYRVLQDFVHFYASLFG